MPKRRKKKRNTKKKEGNKPYIPQNMDLDKIFCMMAKKYKLEKLLLKAVAKVESNLLPNSYRFEPAFWDKYLKDNPEWSDKDPKEVSASYGIMQIMYTTAHMLGFRGPGEELYNPVVNIELGAKLLSQHFKKIKTTNNTSFWPQDIALAWYNGGARNNPKDDGTFRNPEYVRLVKKAYWFLRETEEEC